MVCYNSGAYIMENLIALFYQQKLAIYGALAKS
mgnify:FL=1